VRLTLHPGLCSALRIPGYCAASRYAARRRLDALSVMSRSAATACTLFGPATASARVLERDQDRQLEQLAKRRPAELAQHRFRYEEVPALDRPVEGCSRMSLRRQQPACLAGAER
jgi:hypothetical protein